MNEPAALAAVLEDREEALAEFMAAWLEAGARVAVVGGARGRSPQQTCREIVQDLVRMLRTSAARPAGSEARASPNALPTPRARQLACSAVQEYLRSADDVQLEEMARSRALTQLLSRYFLGGDSPPRSPRR